MQSFVSYLNLYHQVALEKLKLEQVNFKFSDSPSRTVVFLNTFEFVLNLTPPHYECQDVTGENENDTKKKKDVARLLKTALGVELKEKLIGSLFFMESPPSLFIWSFFRWRGQSLHRTVDTSPWTLHNQVLQTVMPLKLSWATLKNIEMSQQVVPWPVDWILVVLQTVDLGSKEIGLQKRHLVNSFKDKLTSEAAVELKEYLEYKVFDKIVFLESYIFSF